MEGGQGNRLKGSVSGERLSRLCALITLRAVDSDLEFAVSKVADLPDEGRAYVEHVTTPDPLRERSGGSQSSSELARCCPLPRCTDEQGKWATQYHCPTTKRARPGQGGALKYAPVVPKDPLGHPRHPRHRNGPTGGAVQILGAEALV